MTPRDFRVQIEALPDADGWRLTLFFKRLRLGHRDYSDRLQMDAALRDWSASIPDFMVEPDAGKDDRSDTIRRWQISRCAMQLIGTPSHSTDDMLDAWAQTDRQMARDPAYRDFILNNTPQF